MKLSNKQYNFLKWLLLIVLPAFVTMYNVVANTWNFSYTSEITQTLIAIQTFLGVIMGISQVQHNKLKGNTK